MKYQNRTKDTVIKIIFKIKLEKHESYSHTRDQPEDLGSSETETFILTKRPGKVFILFQLVSDEDELSHLINKHV